MPAAVLQLTPADGPAFGEVALTHPALAGVAFTGSTATAATINRTLAARDGPIVPLIAETGGVNAMVVDATALPEQVVDDAITSAFTSAGPALLGAAGAVPAGGDRRPRDRDADRRDASACASARRRELATDVGPVISEGARARLARHAERMRAEASLVYACELDAALAAAGHYFPPQMFELRSPRSTQDRGVRANPARGALSER